MENKDTEIIETEEKEAETETKPKKDREKFIEIIVAIALGITAFATAWASWIGSLHGGNQSTNYTSSNNMAADGNSRYNEASQQVMQDMITWNSINDCIIEQAFAEEKGDEVAVEKYNWKIEKIIADNCSPEFADAINWAINQDEDVSPFDKEGYLESYYADANEVLAESEALLEQGKKDNANGDSYNLVTVIYSIVLFMLGIISIFKRIPNRMIILCVAIVAFIIATVYMITIPMPTGFSFANFFHR